MKTGNRKPVIAPPSTPFFISGVRFPVSCFPFSSQRDVCSSKDTSDMVGGQ
jgi:hypothetical protein